MLGSGKLSPTLSGLLVKAVTWRVTSGSLEAQSQHWWSQNAGPGAGEQTETVPWCGEPERAPRQEDCAPSEGLQPRAEVGYLGNRE